MDDFPEDKKSLWNRIRFSPRRKTNIESGRPLTARRHSSDLVPRPKLLRKSAERTLSNSLIKTLSNLEIELLPACGYCQEPIKCFNRRIFLAIKCTCSQQKYFCSPQCHRIHWISLVKSRCLFIHFKKPLSQPLDYRDVEYHQLINFDKN